ncbi:MAG: 30S ribosome-binding factor RbfA [Treponema sp.]|nr:30S ribosome-binding factor RbfA [Treponema sp.]
MGEYRLVRLGEQLRDEISQMILRQHIKDPRVSTFLNINRVEVAGDLKYAKVYVSSFLSEAQVKKGVEGLNSAAGFIQSTIAKKLTIRQFPRLTFIADMSMKEGFDMVNKLNRLEAESKANEMATSAADISEKAATESAAEAD